MDSFRSFAASALLFCVAPASQVVGASDVVIQSLDGRDGGRAIVAFTPKFDIAGKWNDGHPFDASITRMGKQVKGTYNTEAHEHVFEGEYTDENTIVGIQVRKNKSDGSLTRMAVTLVLLSKDEAKCHWIALDSNSGLAQGQSGTNVLRRVVQPAT